MKIHATCFVYLALTISYAGQAVADEVLVAVASNFAAPMEVLVESFENETSHDVNLVYGSSGRLYAQIRNGAPFQIFLSADQEKPQLLEDEQLIVPDSRFTYASGVLVLWSASPERAVDGPEVLSLPFRRLSIANPQLAPYGEAAIEVLASLNLTDEVEDKLVRGENIAQAYQFVESGNAELGFVALSQVGKGDDITHGSGWIVPQELHEPILQDVVGIASASECSACDEFLRFLNSSTARRIILDFGYR